MRDSRALAARPTAEQIERFRALSPDARYRWLASVMQTTYTLAPETTRARWRAMKVAQSSGFLGVASRLAAALDRADFAGAAGFLDTACAYEKGDEALVGPAAIIASYEASHARATSTLDRIVYRSRVEPLAPGVARIAYEDHLEKNGARHVFRCEQDVSVGRSRLVERIVHRELEGERAALEAFLSP